MNELTLDDAIKHCLEVAEENDLAAGTYEILAENNHNAYERLTAETNSSRCAECAADHRQLAEWLTKLKEAKRLLKAAVEDFETIESNLEYDEHCVIKTHSIRCDECPLSAATIYRCKWRYADEALALIGEDANVGHKSGGWISVKDKLPEVGKLVIVCSKQGGVGAMELLSNGKWYSNGMAWSAEWIVYWQPLPDPPKDGDTNERH